MKRFGCLMLAIMMLGLLLIGCDARSGPSGIAPTERETVAQNPSGVADIVENVLGVDIDEKTLTVESVQTIDGQTVAHCTQNYQGVEILGGAMVAIGGTDAQVIGTYYDLSEAFDDSFADQVQEASQVPDWMEDGWFGNTYVTYHTETLKPAIYLADDVPVVVRQFDLTVKDDTGDIRYTIISDLEGEGYYRYSCDYMAFNSTQTQDGIFVAEQDGKYYAYDMEHGIYIANFSDAEADVLDSYYDGSGAKVEESLVYRLEGNDDDEIALEVLSALGDVMGWFEECFDYRGVDGKGGEAMVLVNSPLDNIAANASQYGHVFVTSVTKKGETAADAPEILAHEMGHAVLKNKVGLEAVNQGAALHEAISDVFASLYDPDADWVVGDGLYDVAGKDITSYNQTMADFRYNYQYTVNDDGSYDYAGEEKIRTYLVEQLSIFRGTDKESNRAKYYNARIVSGVMYRIWRDVFQKDNRLFGEVLWDSLQYLPKTADFAQFRAAFMYSTRKLAGSEVARRVGMLFDTVGIYHEPDNFAVIQEKETPNTLLEMLDKTFGDVRAMPWDSCDFAEVEDQWYCFCEKDGYSLNFTYEGSDEADPKALPVSLDLFYYNDEEPIDPVPVAKGLKFGMTYGEIGEKFDISPLENTEYAGSEYPVIARIETEKYSVVLIFDGVDENALFNGVTIMKK